MVKIYILELISPICDKDKSFFLSRLDSSEIKMLPDPEGENYELLLLGKVLVKKVISDETSTPIENILISKTTLGKPIIKSPNNLHLDISISHSGNYLVVGIYDGGKIGVDIELLKSIDFGVLRNCLSTNEEIYINSGQGIGQRLENFYEIWTRKEACSKALGTGLQRPLPITQFYPDHTKPRTEIRHDNQQYYLSTLKEDTFVLSVCTTDSTQYNQIYTKITLDKFRSAIASQKKSDQFRLG
tara:strand:+ start:2391 stop:3119 length:729 start_codon:yes stop_codon:yes gene_type:complete